MDLANFTVRRPIEAWPARTIADCHPACRCHPPWGDWKPALGRMRRRSSLRRVSSFLALGISYGSASAWSLVAVPFGFDITGSASQGPVGRESSSLRHTRFVTHRRRHFHRPPHRRFFGCQPRVFGMACRAGIRREEVRRLIDQGVQLVGCYLPRVSRGPSAGRSACRYQLETGRAASWTSLAMIIYC